MALVDFLNRVTSKMQELGDNLTDSLNAKADLVNSAVDSSLNNLGALNETHIEEALSSSETRKKINLRKSD